MDFLFVYARLPLLASWRRFRHRNQFFINLYQNGL